MILLLGATGYVGQAFARELRARGDCFIPLARDAFDYSRFDLLFEYVRKIRPDFLINASAYAGAPNVDACETSRMETFKANTLLPQTVARVCLMTNTPWGHVSSGAIYTGAKVFDNGEMRVVRDLNQPEMRTLYDSHPEMFFGFTESDEPNFSFRNPPCSFLGGTKALAEEALRGQAQTYIWRARLPFAEQDHPSNLLTKLLTYKKVHDHITSLSHLGDFVHACLALVDRRAPFGVYNMTNTGAISIRRIIEMIQRHTAPERRFEFFADDAEFYSQPGKAPRSSCILDVTKLLRTGVKMRNVDDALRDALTHWQSAAPVEKEPAPALDFLPA
jgi:UDP-glucose 4,6-dehydratase